VGALGLRELSSRNVRAGRWLLVLTCYLDDSGKDPQNRVTTLAGYVARDTAWEKFETQVEPIFDRAKVKVLHARELEESDGDFRGWKVLNKQAFVARMCRTLSDHSMLGVSISVVKDTYKRRAKESGRKRTVTPYTYGFNTIIDWLLRDIRTGRAVWNEGLALVLECGHENNPEAEEQFYKIRKQHTIEHILRSSSFVPKEHCRAIQMADLFAFYTRRDSAALEKAFRLRNNPRDYEPEAMVKIIAERGQFRSFVATDFDPSARRHACAPRAATPGGREK
jgi:Protein of unknown function (DUF3800)